MKILVLSQPKSGSTAMYYKVKRALPETAAGYFEPSDLPAVTEGVRRQQDAVCKYLLQPWSGELEPGLRELIAAFDRVIVLHRDPRDFMVSCYLYSFFNSFTANSIPGMAQTLRLLERKERNPASISFLELVRLKNVLEECAYIKPDFGAISTRLDAFGNRLDLGPHPLMVHNAQFDLNSGLLDADLQVSGFLSYVFRSCRALIELKSFLDAEGGPIHWFPYADLVAEHFDAVEAYLERSIPNKVDVDARHSRVVRTKGRGDWKQWVTPSDLPWLRENFHEFLQIFEYEADWELPWRQWIDPAYGSDYVFRLFLERHRSDLGFSRQTLTELADYLWNPEAAPGVWLPGLESLRREEVGSPSVEVDDIRFEDSQARRVNLICPGERYHYVYQVRFSEGFSGVDFWMQITNPDDYGVVNGSSMLGEHRRREVRAGESFEVRFPMTCDLQNGLYFCNAGVTHRRGKKLEVLHRRVAAIPIVVYAIPTEKEWLVPDVTGD